MAQWRAVRVEMGWGQAGHGVGEGQGMAQWRKTLKKGKKTLNNRVVFTASKNQIRVVFCCVCLFEGRITLHLTI